MDLFSIRLSKKTSEAGVWTPDQEVNECAVCKRGFNLINRRHHCRKCGAVVCGKCSEQRMFLESSRSGSLKRVCDKCYNESRKAETDSESEEDTQTTTARKGMNNMSLGGSSSSSSSTTARAAVINTSSSNTTNSQDPSSPSSPAVKRGASSNKLVPKGPDIPLEEAMEALKTYTFDGKWKTVLTFQVVEMGNTAARAEVPGLDVASFKSSAAGNTNRKGTLTKDGMVRTGSRVEVWLHLQPKGAAYFQGTCASFGQFGKEGKVTGALQRSIGKINMTVQMVNNKVTTSFNFVGLMNKSGIYQGTFSGCEISKNAGSVSGVFKCYRDEEGEEGEGAQDAGEDDNSDNSNSSDDEPVKNSKKGSSSNSKSSTTTTTSASTKNKPKKKTSSDDDSD